MPPTSSKSAKKKAAAPRGRAPRENGEKPQTRAQQIAAAEQAIEDIISEVPQTYDPAMPIDDVRPDPRNANQGDEGSLAMSVGRIGQHGAITVWWEDPDGNPQRLISAGEHRWRDWKRRGATTIRAFKCILAEWQHRMILANDNRITRLGMDDPAKQLDNLDALMSTVGLLGSSYDEDDIAELRQLVSHAGTGDGQTEAEDPTKGELLRLAAITIREPQHKVERGDWFDLTGGKKPHTMICLDVFANFDQYKDEVGDDAMFCPFPGVILPLTAAGDRSRLVLVQPDPYLAGHLLDRWSEAHGKSSVVKRNGK